MSIYDSKSLLLIKHKITKMQVPRISSCELVKNTKQATTIIKIPYLDKTKPNAFSLKIILPGLNYSVS